MTRAPLGRRTVRRRGPSASSQELSWPSARRGPRTPDAAVRARRRRPPRPCRWRARRRSTPPRSSPRCRTGRSRRSTRCGSPTAWCRRPTAGTRASCSATSRSRCSPSRCRSRSRRSGFTVGLPAPTVSAQTIAAPHVPALTVDVGAASARISAADPVSVTVELLDALGRGARARRARRGLALRVASPRRADVERPHRRRRCPRRPTVRPPRRASDGRFVGPALRRRARTALTEGETATWYALPDAPTRRPPRCSRTPRPTRSPASTSPTAWTTTRRRTTLTYRTADDGASAHVLMPHHTVGGPRATSARTRASTATCGCAPGRRSPRPSPCSAPPGRSTSAA